MKIDIPNSGGAHTGTEWQNGVLVLAPAPIFTTFPGDTSTWQVSGDAWTLSGDQASLNNPNGNNDFLSAIYGIQQTVADPVTFRIKASGNVSQSSSNWGIELILTDSGGLGGTTLGSQSANFPAGQFSDIQLSVSVTPSAPAYYLYAYIFTRTSAGSITLWDAEVFQSSGVQGHYGYWESDSIDLYALAAIPISTYSLGMEKACFYYGNISDVDGAYSVDHSISMLKKFDHVIINEPSQNTTTRQQYVQAQLVAAPIKVYGYINIGVSEMSWNNCIPPVSHITSLIDNCANAAYDGVMFDGAGVPVEYLNYLADYCHTKSLSVIANTQPQAVMDPAINASVIAAPNYAPTLAAVTDASATLPAGTYTVGWTRTNYMGETTLSPTATIAIVAGQGVAVSGVSGDSMSVQGINFYLSVAAGSSTLGLIQQGDGSNFTALSLPPGGAQNPPVANTCYLVNPNGVTTHLNSGDYTVWESFYTRSDDQYASVAYGGWNNIFPTYQQSISLSKQYGVKILALAYAFSTTALDNNADMDNAYLLALGLGFDAFSYAHHNTADGVLDWYDYPQTPVGTTLVTELSFHNGNTYYAQTDQGVIWFLAQDTPFLNESGVFSTTSQIGIMLGSVPVASAVRITPAWQTSPDGINWTALAGTATLVTMPNIQRYVRYTVELRG